MRRNNKNISGYTDLQYLLQEYLSILTNNSSNEFTLKREINKLYTNFENKPSKSKVKEYLMALNNKYDLKSTLAVKQLVVHLILPY